MDWQKGDIVICINNGVLSGSKLDPDYFIKNHMSIRLDGEYIVHNIYKCPKCDNILLDVGIRNLNGRNIGCGCGEDVPMKEVRWFAEERFKKKSLKRKNDIPFLEDEEH